MTKKTIKARSKATERTGKKYPKVIERMRAGMMKKEWFLFMGILKHSGSFIGAFAVFWVVREIEKTQDPGTLRTIAVVLKYLIAALTILYAIPGVVLDRWRYEAEQNQSADSRACSPESP